MMKQKLKRALIGLMLMTLLLSTCGCYQAYPEIEELINNERDGGQR